MIEKYDILDKCIIKTEDDLKKMNENNFFEIGIIQEWVNQNIKGDQLASFVIYHIWLCPMCELTLELELL